ncbi:MAG: hypothetical protein ABIT01_11630 [Thermoanaerobaculia bacterium]
MSEIGPIVPPGEPDRAASAAAATGSPLDEAGYATLLEEAFIAERGTPFLLSSKDWQLIQGWLKAGIPADCAVRAVRETFEKRRARGQTGKIGSIGYCANAVEERWEMERRGLVGRGDGTRDEAPESIADRLKRLLAALSAAAEKKPEGIDATAYRRTLEHAIEKIEAFPPGVFEEIEAALSALEGSVTKKLQKALDEAPLAALEQRVDEALGEPGAVSADIRERTRRALTKREVRRLLQLPVLTLFDL